MKELASLQIGNVVDFLGYSPQEIGGYYFVPGDILVVVGPSNMEDAIDARSWFSGKLEMVWPEEVRLHRHDFPKESEISMSDTCTCGDVRDEHGGDPEYPGSTACTIEGCECISFEEDLNADEDNGQWVSLTS